MIIDKKTLLVESFENVDTHLLLDEIRTVIVDGEIKPYFRKIGEEWMKQANFSENLGLVGLSTVFPLKMLQSYIDHFDIIL